MSNHYRPPDMLPQGQAAREPQQAGRPLVPECEKARAGVPARAFRIQVEAGRLPPGAL
jgi:hypothetical protein